MALGYLWAGLCWLCTALYRMTSVGLYAEEMAARDRSPPCPENRVPNQTFDEPELPLRRRNLTSRESVSDSWVEQGTRRSVGFHDEVEEIPSGTFSRDAPTATSTPVGSHSVTRPESYEVSGSGQVNGHGEYRPTRSSVSSPPVQNFDDSVPQPSPQLSATSFPSYWGSDVTQGSVQAGRKSYKPEKYDGSTDWTDYLKHFEIVSQWNGWSDLEKAAQLSMSMTGVARQTWSDICSDPSMLFDYRSLVKGMGQRFKPEGQEVTYKAEFRGRVKQKDETFLEYGYCLRRLAIRAFSKLGLEGREEMAKDQFVLGLADAEMRRHVSLAHPTTLDKAIALATEFDVVSQASRSHVQHKPKPVSVVQDSQPSVSGDRELLQQILETMTKLTDRQSRPPRNRSNIRCFECQEVGHIKRNCPKLKQTEEVPLND